MTTPTVEPIPPSPQPNPKREGASSPLWRIVAAAVVLALFSPLAAPIDVPEWYSDARRALGAEPQDLETARAALARAADRLPYDGLTQYRAGQVALAAGDAEAALARFQAAFSLIDVGAAEHVALGDAYLAQGKRAEAVAEFETARAADPQNTNTLGRLAKAYEADARYADAVAALAQLSQAGAADAQQLYRLGVLTSVVEPSAAASRLAVAAEVPSPYQAPARQLLDAVSRATAQTDPALVYGTIGIALVQLAEWPPAEAALQQAVTANDTFADAFAYLGLARDRQGKDGAQALAQAAALTPDSPLVNFLYGLHFRSLSQSADALPWLHKAQAADPNNPAIAAELGGAYAATGDLANGEVWFRKAVSLNDRDGQFWLLLARFYVDRDYKIADEGLPAARMAVGLNPNSALAADALGYALVLTGDGLTGKQELERALDLDPGSAAANYHLGAYFLSANDAETAKIYFNQAMALDPQGPYGDLAVKALALIGTP